MNFVEINNSNKNKMKNSLQNQENHFEWEDSSILEYFLGNLPKIRDQYDEHDKIQDELRKLHSIYSDYDCYSTDKTQFLEKLKTIISEINEKTKHWYGLDIYYVEYCLEMHQSCLISGEGGIGKSYFIYQLEEELSKQRIKHLCVYGKYQKELTEIDFDEIIDISNKEQFVFIADAINELPKESIEYLITKLELLKNTSKTRIILTYRTYSLDQNYVEMLRKLTKAHYNFPGVSYESALEILTRNPLKNANAYTDILFTNNALLISKLIKILLDNEKRTDLDSVTSITYIFEHDFKEGLKAQRKILSHDPVWYWEMTKLVVEKMFDTGSKAITITELESLMSKSDVQDYLSGLKMLGYVDVYNYRDNHFIQFSTDSVIDYLLSRYLIKRSACLSEENLIELIDSKLKAFPSALEPFILGLFDKYKGKYTELYSLLEKTDLLNEVSLDLLAKIVFNEMTKEKINKFLDVFKLENPVSSVLYFAGYLNKPFNCKNYLNNYLISNSEKQLTDLSKCLSDNYECTDLSRRLKNMLYYITLSTPDEEILFEYFYTALWCSSAPNQNVRLLSRKLLFDTIRINTKLIDEAINVFPNIKDYYIQDAIIEVLYFHKNNESIKKFFTSLKNDFSYVSEINIARIAEYLSEKNEYIKWNKINLYNKTTRVISDEFSHYLFYLDGFEKHLLHFRYWSKNRIDEMLPEFINKNKKDIYELNKKLDREFACVKTGECNGEYYLKDWIKAKYNLNYKLLPTVSFLKSFEKIIKFIFQIYDFNPNKDNNSRYRKFSNSLERKLVCIAQDIYFGSLICNYYDKTFYSFDENNMIGYGAYDPLHYNSSENIACPIPTYDSNIEQIQDTLLTHIDESSLKIESWVKNADITRKNVLSLINTPVVFKNKTWILLATQIFMQDESRSESSWKDNYDISCCVSEDLKLNGDEDDRYLTIEHRNYYGLLEDYSRCEDESELCKDVKEISYGSDIIDETNLLIPPAKLIKDLNLKPKYNNLSWVNSEGEEIILCNNNKSNYYRDIIKRSIFIRQDIYDEYFKSHRIKYFVFTEKLIPGHGYDDETSLHMEVENGEIQKEYNNYNTRKIHANKDSEVKCENCIHGFKRKIECKRNSVSNLPDFLNFYIEKNEDLFNSENVEIYTGKDE